MFSTLSTFTRDPCFYKHGSLVKVLRGENILKCNYIMKYENIIKPICDFGNQSSVYKNHNRNKIVGPMGPL